MARRISFALLRPKALYHAPYSSREHVKQISGPPAAFCRAAASMLTAIHWCCLLFLTQEEVQMASDCLSSFLLCYFHFPFLSHQYTPGLPLPSLPYIQHICILWAFPVIETFLKIVNSSQGPRVFPQRAGHPYLCCFCQ